MSDLYDELKQYNDSGAYAFHMPGHKRNNFYEFCDPFKIDITEIDGFDDLHHAEGILKECMDYAAQAYGTKKTYFLVNGSTAGLLSAVFATAEFGYEIIIARNCHKSVYNAVELRGAHPLYVYPDYIDEFGISGGINPEKVEELLKEHENVKAVVVVSPTYDGVCSDIKAIAEIVHKYNRVLVVDEAHGAHFKYNDCFPETAVRLGADIVIQSLHKTLPSLTQTALLHVCTDRVDVKKIEKYLSIFQSSSPSYVLMAGIDKCIKFMNNDGVVYMEEYCSRLRVLRQELAELKNIKMVSKAIVDKASVYDYDCGKIIISAAGFTAGKLLYDILRLRYNIQPEMCTVSCVTLMTSLCDSKEAFEHLEAALREINNHAGSKSELIKLLDGFADNYEGLAQGYTLENTPKEAGFDDNGSTDLKICDTMVINQQVYTPWHAVTLPKWSMDYRYIPGETVAEYVYIYPPGIPLLVPGEKINKADIKVIERYQNAGLKVHGLKNNKLVVVRRYGLPPD
ncbi:MAG: aminotransferase class I/II-fold pyridoxal phosphate-dependent enzyme [Lachnospiraceae bacterium]|nr:aminotransferase class I/II-fold pyridoxal phosphate-dependent enzyme [Lachnospiraceae bacterium]